MNKLIPLLATALLGACAIPNHNMAGPPGFNWEAYYANRRDIRHAAYQTQAPAPTVTAQQSPPEDALTAAAAERQQDQGKMSRPPNSAQCNRLVLDIPPGASGGRLWSVGQPSVDSPYLTQQENYCLAEMRAGTTAAGNSFPGILPEGARAVPTGNGYWQIYQD